MKRKRFNLVFINFFVTTSVLFVAVSSLTSCAKKPYSLTWTGTKEQFVVSYDKYPQPTITSDVVFNQYVNKNNFDNMLSQDCIHKMNTEWKKWEPSLNLTYVITNPHKKNDRLSWDLQILDEQNQLLLWWTITNLKYTWKFNNAKECIELIPFNWTCDDEYHVRDEFWDDQYFNIVIKWKQSADQDWVDPCEFSWKTMATFDREKLNDYLAYIVITPYYYDGVTLEGS